VAFLPLRLACSRTCAGTAHLLDDGARTGRALFLIPIGALFLGLAGGAPWAWRLLPAPLAVFYDLRGARFSGGQLTMTWSSPWPRPDLPNNGVPAFAANARRCPLGAVSRVIIPVR
jgi:hypothetical protein